MASVTSGVETGNDSNDGAQLENLSNQSLINGSTAIISTEKQIATTQKHEQKLMESEFLTPIANSTAESFIMTDYNLPKLQFKIPLNPKFEFLEDRAERLELKALAMRAKYGLKQDTIKRMNFLKRKCDSYRNFMLERQMRLAANTNNVDLIKEVLEKGLSPNISDHSKRTPLHLAACRGSTDIVKLLLDYGANVNEVDSLGRTPLLLATSTCKYDVITLLLEAGANVLPSDRHGYNLLELARWKLRLLQSHRRSDMNRIEEVLKIIKMLLAYLIKQNNAHEEIEELSLFCSRISVSNTQDQIQYDLNRLLASIDALSLTT